MTGTDAALRTAALRGLRDEFKSSVQAVFRLAPQMPDYWKLSNCDCKKAAGPEIAAWCGIALPRLLFSASLRPFRVALSRVEQRPTPAELTAP
jgi:hypothetical protein